MRSKAPDHTKKKGSIQSWRECTCLLTVPLGRQEMRRSWRSVSPMCVQGASSMLPRPVQSGDCSGKESRQAAFTGTSPSPGCEGSRISDLGSLPSSPEGNYLQETSQTSRSTTSPQTSPTTALTLSGLHLVKGLWGESISRINAQHTQGVFHPQREDIPWNHSRYCK